jgi:hypothetical protein
MEHFLSGAWNPKIEWESDAGKTLALLFRHFPAQRPYSITLFGSSPIQLGIDRDFKSADVDLFTDREMEVVQTSGRQNWSREAIYAD